MARTGSRWGALALAGATLGALAIPAIAEETGRIVQVIPGAGQVQVVFTAEGLPPDATLDAGSVAAQFGGLDIPGVTAEPVGRTSAVTRTAVLTIDTSGSMQEDDRIGAAQQAATDYLDAVPRDVSVGLISFADTAQVLVAPTTDRRAVRQAIDSLQATGATALYDATVLAARTVGTEGSRSVLLLSDGTDEGSTRTLAQATAAAKASGAKFDAVALGTSDQVAALQAISGATGGTVTTAADAAQLTAAFASSAQSITNELLVTIPVSAEISAEEGNLTLTAAVNPGGTVVGASAFVALPEVSDEVLAAEFGPTPANTNPAWWTQPWVLALALGMVLLSGTVLLSNAFRSAGEASRTSSVRRRLSLYSLTGQSPVKESEETTALGDSTVAKSAVELADRVVAKRDFEELLASRLEAAGIPLKASEWTLLHTGIALGGGLLLLLISGGRLLPAAIGLAFGLAGPWLYLSYKKSKRQSAFLASLPDTLQLLSGSLAAGYSLPQAVDTVSREATEPIAGEFNRALVEARLGVTIEDALDGVAVRMDSEDFRWVVMAIRIQREVGGNLAEVLSTVAATLRERERLRRQVKVLSAEGRLSAVILAGLPVVFTLYLILVRPEYISLLVTNPLGWAMILVGVIAFIAGVLWMRKVVDVEV